MDSLLIFFKVNLKSVLVILLCILTSHSFAQEKPQDSSTFLIAELLAWKLREGSADNWAQEISPSGTSRTTKVLGVPFKFSPGLRLGIGRNSCADCWDTVFSYTWFKTSGRDQACVNSGGIYSPFLGNFFINNTSGTSFGPNYFNASIKWKLNYNILDLEFGRTFKPHDFLKLRPFVGLKGGSINQHIYSTWQNPTTATTFTSATENLKNDFWGLGPVIGLNTTWPLSESNKNSFNLLGNFSAALLYGHWSFQDVYQNNTPASVTVKVGNINGAATMARALLGIEWVNHRAKSDISVRLGYEAQIWFNQMQFYSYNMGRLNNLLSLQGITLGINAKL